MSNSTEEMDNGKQKKISKKSGSIEQVQPEPISEVQIDVDDVDPVETVVDVVPVPLTKKEEKQLLKALVHPSRIKVKKVKIPNLKVIGKQATKHFNSF